MYYHLEATPSETHTRWSNALLKNKGSDQTQNQHGDKGSDQGQHQDKGWLSLPPPNPFISYDLATSPIISDTTPRSNNNNNNNNNNNDDNDDNNENNNKDNINTPTTTSLQRALRSPPPIRLPRDAQEQGLGQGQGQGLSVFSWLSQDAVFNQPKTVFQLLLHTDRCVLTPVPSVYTNPLSLYINPLYIYLTLEVRYLPVTTTTVTVAH